MICSVGRRLKYVFLVKFASMFASTDDGLDGSDGGTELAMAASFDKTMTGIVDYVQDAPAPFCVGELAGGGGDVAASMGCSYTAAVQFFPSRFSATPPSPASLWASTFHPHWALSRTYTLASSSCRPATCFTISLTAQY